MMRSREETLRVQLRDLRKERMKRGPKSIGGPKKRNEYEQKDFKSVCATTTIAGLKE